MEFNFDLKFLIRVSVVEITLVLWKRTAIKNLTTCVFNIQELNSLLFKKALLFLKAGTILQHTSTDGGVAPKR